jgi:lipid II:glycine glycyltransferase (peptidoglycan interpeptide bridge formation enzyme)
MDRSNINNLDDGFTAEVDAIDQSQWSAVIQEFADATIYQTWEYGSQTWGDKNISHLILKKNEQIIAAAQLWIYTIPLLRKGFAHISWGPMWRQHSKKKDFQVLKNLLRALNNHYSHERRLLLRIRINEIQRDNDVIERILIDEGFHLNKQQHQYRTIRLTLEPDIDEIRSRLHKTWKRYLKRAEENKIQVLDGYQLNLFTEFDTLYTEMVERKKMTRYISDINAYKNIQKYLSEKLKLRIFLGNFENELMGSLVIAVIGDTGMYLFGSSSTKSIKMKLYVSYLLHWRVIIWLKEHGFKYYDLRGYEPDVYPGPSAFKAGLAGDDVRFIGTLEIHEDLASLIIVRLGEAGDLFLEKLKSLIKNIKNVMSPLLRRNNNVPKVEIT